MGKVTANLDVNKQNGNFPPLQLRRLMGFLGRRVQNLVLKTIVPALPDGENRTIVRLLVLSQY